MKWIWEYYKTGLKIYAIGALVNIIFIVSILVFAQLFGDYSWIPILIFLLVVYIPISGYFAHKFWKWDTVFNKKH